MSARDIAKRALLEAAILGELAEANQQTREQLAEAGMEPGDKVTAGDLGYVQITSPKPALKVVDWSELGKWIEDNAPDQGLVTKVEVSQYFVKKVLADGGQWINADGEVLEVPGLGVVAGASQLRVVPSDAAHETAREILGGSLQQIEGS